MDNKRLKVLIVDDEVPIREELRSFSWEQFHCEVASEARHGEEALELCRSQHFDVVVTDISMPIMNGLELTRVLCKEYPRVQVILLTCHDEFDFAREAIKLGAVDYILKTAMIDMELGESLVKARERIKDRELSQQGIFNQKRMDISYTLKKIMTSEKMPAQTELTEFDLHFEYSFPMALLCVDANHENLLQIDMEIGNVAFFFRNFHIIPLELGAYAIFCELPDESLPWRQYIVELLEKMKNHLNEQLHFLNEEIRLYGSLADRVHDQEELIRALNRLNALRNLHFYDEETVLFDNEAAVEYVPMDPKNADDFLQQIKRYTSPVEFVRKDFPDWCREHAIIPMELMRFISRWLKANQSLEVSSLSELRSRMLRELNGGSECPDTISPLMEEAAAFIQEHYGENITIQQVADRLDMKEYQFRKSFRDELGEPFHEYVTRFRIEQAKALLVQSDMKVYEIAERNSQLQVLYHHIQENDG